LLVVSIYSFISHITSKDHIMSTNANTHAPAATGTPGGIDFHRTFGAAPAPTSVNGKGNSGDRPKAKFWLNIGYDSGVADEASGGTKFVSLPAGIPLDGQERLATNSRNHEFAAFQSARNNLMDQIMARAEQLKPGEEVILNLSIQLRRVNDEQAEIAPDQNQFIRELKF
jgi:hypothetical protein